MEREEKESISSTTTLLESAEAGGVSVGSKPESAGSESTVARLVAQWNRGGEIRSIQPLTPDASLRRYFRVELGAHSPSIHSVISSVISSVIGVVYDSVSIPEAGGGQTVNSFDAFVLLNERLRLNRIPVPEIYLTSREPYAALLEDLGDEVLASSVLTKGESEEVVRRYKEAIDILLLLQQVPTTPSFFAFERSFSASTYQSEMEEFLLYYLAPKEQESLGGSLRHLFHSFGVRLEQCRRVPVHRDYHSWNIMRDRSGLLRVIDYQDTLLGSRCYDVVGLLNDRDTDSALGGERHEELLQYFLLRAGELYGENREVLRREFLEHSVQRDLKVVGRFSKLVQERGLVSYAQWIPGTLARLQRTVHRLSEDDAFFLQMHQLLEEGVRLS